MTDIVAQSRDPVFPVADKMKKGTLKSNDGQTTIHFAGDTENLQMLMKLILSCNFLCMLLSVAQILDDQPSLSYVTERDLDVGNGDFTSATT